jgi:hypothetical protein
MFTSRLRESGEVGMSLSPLSKNERLQQNSQYWITY